ncbi:MAG TPA: response regulator [Chthoniobacterales bacterium]|nr:response regulator [Chthoniobacterales bacterium]
MKVDRLVLVVDDDAIVLRILADQIARAGYVVTPAASITEARHHLNQTLFAVVVADQSMPELTGIDLLRECGAIQPLASRVLVTGTYGLPEVDRALREGEICRLLIKPWTRFDLISLFDQVYERHELLCEKETLRSKITILENQVANLTRRASRPLSPTWGGLPGEPELQLTQPGDEQQLVGKARLETSSKMASGVAHEFNNALIPILGYVELMLERDQLLEDRGKARHYLKLVLSAAKDANRVADRLRHFYRQAEQSEGSKFPGITQEAMPSVKKVGRVLKVLIVDDEKTSRDLVTMLLEADQHEITAASSGTEALQLLRSGSYDLLVTDQEMPRMTGAALVEAVRKSGNSKPIIMLTGFGELMKSSGSTVNGVDLVLNKPVTSEALRSALIKFFPHDVVDAT